MKPYENARAIFGGPTSAVFFRSATNNAPKVRFGDEILNYRKITAIQKPYENARAIFGGPISVVFVAAGLSSQEFYPPFYLARLLCPTFITPSAF